MSSGFRGRHLFEIENGQFHIGERYGGYASPSTEAWDEWEEASAGMDEGILAILPDGEGAELLAIQAGIADGNVWLTIADEQPAPGTWEEHASVEIRITKEWAMTSTNYADETEYPDPIFVPDKPGLHRVDVFARNRALHYDEAMVEDYYEGMEEYLLVFTPV